MWTSVTSITGSVSSIFDEDSEQAAAPAEEAPVAADDDKRKKRLDREQRRQRVESTAIAQVREKEVGVCRSRHS